MVDFSIRGFGGFLVVHSFNASAFSATQFANVSFTLMSPNPVLYVEVGGTMVSGHYSLAVAAISLALIRST
jgi:hypothetical protein